MSTRIVTAAIKSPQGITLYGNDIYVADTPNHVISKINITTGVVTTYIGTGVAGNSATQLNTPTGLAFDNTGVLYIADYGNNLIRKVITTGTTRSLTAIAGESPDEYSKITSKLDYFKSFGWFGSVYIDYVAVPHDNANNSVDAISALLRTPFGILMDKTTSDLYISEVNNSRVYKINNIDKQLSDVASTYGMSQRWLHREEKSYGYWEGPWTNLVTNEEYIEYKYYGKPPPPDTTGGARGLVKDKSGNLYIADDNKHCIIKVDGNFTHTIIAGKESSPGYSGDGGLPTNAQLNSPWSIAIDSQDNIFIADLNNGLIRKQKHPS